MIDLMGQLGRESAKSSAQRREGRALACEGLLASQFGRRPVQAGAKALEQLRTADQAEQQRTIDRQGTAASPAPKIIRFGWGLRRVAASRQTSQEAPSS